MGPAPTPLHCHTRSVAQIRAYQLARELKIETHELCHFLTTAAGWRGSSAVSSVDAAPAAAARAAYAAGAARPRPAPPRPSSRQAFAWDDSWDDDGPRGWSVPDQVTAAEAARLCGVQVPTIRQWASRGYLDAVGKRGLSTLYESAQVRNVQFEVAARTRMVPPPRAGLRSRDLDALVPGSDAAALVGVAPVTIRGWVARGHLKPVPWRLRPDRPLYRVSDVLRAARRPR